MTSLADVQQGRGVAVFFGIEEVGTVMTVSIQTDGWFSGRAKTAPFLTKSIRDFSAFAVALARSGRRGCRHVHDRMVDSKGGRRRSDEERRFGLGGVSRGL